MEILLMTTAHWVFIKKPLSMMEKKIEIAKEVVDRAGEATRYGNLSNAYGAVGDCHKNIEHYEKCLKIAQEIGDRAGEDAGYGNLGNATSSWVIIKKRLSIKKKNRKFQKEPYRGGEGNVYHNIGNEFFCLQQFENSADNVDCAVGAFNAVRSCLKSSDD